MQVLDLECDWLSAQDWIPCLIASRRQACLIASRRQACLIASRRQACLIASRRQACLIAKCNQGTSTFSHQKGYNKKEVVSKVK
ncbi:MAG: hypothetical protein ABI237_10695 [Ginsengibacter sp.]